MSKIINFRVMRGTTLRQMFKWEDFGLVAGDVTCIAREEITSNGVSAAAKFKCGISYEGLEVYLSNVESQRLRNYNRYAIAVQLNNGDVVPCLSGYVEIR
ncbi:hypothetical protein [Aeromonas popoffii]|uniref:hypothetical protein n=1 Tax=Aeromonas popoffii TaxID=70856 RepID=UPI0030D3F7F8